MHSPYHIFFGDRIKAFFEISHKTNLFEYLRVKCFYKRSSLILKDIKYYFIDSFNRHFIEFHFYRNHRLKIIIFLYHTVDFDAVSFLLLYCRIMSRIFHFFHKEFLII